jgi:hypothetical protein
MNDDVAFADQRLRSRVVAIGIAWNDVKAGMTSAVTSPLAIAVVAFSAAAYGARSPAPAKPVACDCAGEPSLLSRTLLVALVGPLLKEAVARGLAQLQRLQTPSAPEAADVSTGAASAARGS